MIAVQDSSIKQGSHSPQIYAVESQRKDFVNTETNQTKMQMIPFEIQIPESDKPLPYIQYEPNKLSSNQKYDNNSNMNANIRKQTIAVIIMSSSIFFLGFYRAQVPAIVNSHTTKQFEQLFNFTGSVIVTKAVLSAMSPFGAFIGTIVCSFLIKKYSPRQILFNSCMFAIICTVTTMYTQIIILLIFRFFMGFTVGIFVALVPSYIRQITSKNVSPYFGTAPVINQSLGGFISFVLGYSLFEGTDHIRDTWIIMCALNVLPLIAIIICTQIDVIYESPIYLLRNGRRNQAVAIYEMIYKIQKVSSIIKQRQLQIKRFYFTQLRYYMVHQKNHCWQRKDILIGIHLPVLRKMSGVLVILLSSGSMLKSINPQFERKAPMLISLVYFISCFLSNVVLKVLNRRQAFQLGTISGCLLNFAIFMCYLFQARAVIILVFKIALLIMYGMTLGPLVWAYLPEVVPARIIPLAQCANWLVDCFTLSLPGVIIAHAGNPWPLFFVFFLWNLISIPINYFILVETKGKTTIQIIRDLDKGISQ